MSDAPWPSPARPAFLERLGTDFVFSAASFLSEP